MSVGVRYTHKYARSHHRRRRRRSCRASARCSSSPIPAKAWPSRSCRSRRRRSRRRSASTTPSSSASTSASRTAGRCSPATPGAACSATTAASPARTRTAAPPERRALLRRPVPGVRHERQPGLRPAADRSAALLQARRPPTTRRGAPTSASSRRSRRVRPKSTSINLLGYSPTFINGRGDLGRPPMYSQIDLYLQHDFRLMGGHRVEPEPEHRQPVRSGGIAQRTPPTPWRDNFSVPSSIASSMTTPGVLSARDTYLLNSGYDPTFLASVIRSAGSRMRDNSLYGRPSGFQGRRQLRLGIRYSF